LACNPAGYSRNPITASRDDRVTRSRQLLSISRPVRERERERERERARAMSINNSYLLPTTERRTVPLLPAAERRTAPPPADRWRHAIGAAFASVRDYTLEGLCLHAMTLHPEFFWSPLDESEQADLLRNPGPSTAPVPLARS